MFGQLDFLNMNNNKFSGSPNLGQGFGTPTDFNSLLKFNRNSMGSFNQIGDSSGGGMGDFMSGIFGKDGWGVPALQGIGMLSGIFSGMNQNKMAKRQLSHAREMDKINLANQTKLTNAALEDRQRARVAANPNAQSVEDYMKKYGV